METGPIIRKGKNDNAVNKNVMTTNTEMNKGPLVLIGSTTSFLSFNVNEPAIANIRPIGTYRPRNITIAVDQFQNEVSADVPK